jgi:hypothetical protein
MSEDLKPSDLETIDQDSRCYEPPRVEKVRIDTTRAVAGYYYGDTHCTLHAHDEGTAECEF